MKIVIDISEEGYNSVTSGKWQGNPLADYIEDGAILPKGHGRLIDADALLRHSDGGDWNGVCYDPEYVKAIYIYNAPTIIEADKEDRE